MSTPNSIFAEINRTTWASELADELLKRINNKGRYSIGFSMNTIVGQAALDILIDEYLVTVSSPLLLGTSLIITEKGKDVIAAGGVEKYCEFWGFNKGNKLRSLSSFNTCRKIH